MRRGEVWTLAGGPGYTGKPRPVVIVQHDGFADTQSVTVCALTTHDTPAELFRLAVQPSEDNGLRAQSRLMVDKITTAPRSKLGARIGRLADADMSRLDRAMITFLGLAT